MYVHPLYHWPPKTEWIHSSSATQQWNPYVAYVHFPFCRSICNFCGYETRLIQGSAAKSFAFRAVEQIEWRARRDTFNNARLEAVFLGGGTASLIPQRGLSAILEALATLESGDGVREITLECEPGTISANRLASASKAGVNRVSVGAQSLNDTLLKRIGRRHDVSDVYRLIDHCQSAGIENIHVDLMFGLPEQSLALWERTLRTVVSLPITHISSYKLYVFLHGAFHRADVAPRAEAESDKRTRYLRDMYDSACAILETSGFHQYTLTEFSRPGFESRYIRSCFDGGDLLPIGPGGFGRCGAELWENTPYVKKYMDEAVFEPGRVYRLSRPAAFKRDLILGMWLLDLNLNHLIEKHGVVPSHRLVELLQKLNSEGLLTVSPDRIYLTAGQRFGVGAAMQRLAELDTAEWAVPAPSKVFDDCEQNYRTRARPISNALATLLRTARRDATLFRQLCDHPLATLATLNVDLSLDERDAFVSIVRGTEIRGEGESTSFIGTAWSDLTAEHWKYTT